MRVKSFLLAAVAASTFGAMGVAQAGEGVEVSANVAFTSDYRFRGVSLSDNNFAVQGGFDVSTESGVYVGTWASNVSIPGEGDTELDFYGGYSGEAGGLGFDVGAILYAYPETEDFNYYEVYGSLSGTAGIVDVTVGLAYVPEQDNTGEEDNVYIYVDGGLPLGESDVSLGLHLGFEDGAFGDEKTDYSISLNKSAGGLDLSLAYVGTDGADGFGDISDDAAVFTVSKSM